MSAIEDSSSSDHDYSFRKLNKSLPYFLHNQKLGEDSLSSLYIGLDTRESQFLQYKKNI